MDTADRPQGIAVPQAWLERVGELAGRRTLTVAGLEILVEVKEAWLHRVVLPVLALLDPPAGRRRVLAGLGGIPGSGKSTLAGMLQQAADVLLGPGHLVAVGLDGWHFPNALLDSRTTADATGRRIPLRQRKGGPASFDVPALVEALDRLAPADRPVRVPVYDRRIHEPVPDALEIPPSTRVVLIEGNFVLGGDSPWDAVGRRLSPRLFLECDEQTAQRRVIDRHVRGGSSAAEAASRYEHNDRLNAAIARQTAALADYLILPDPPGLIRNDR